MARVNRMQRWQTRVKAQVQRWWASYTAVTAIPVGRNHDGLTLRPAGTLIDKPWHELFQEVEDAREAWRKNPLARRLIGLITSYTVGNGITLSSEKRDLHNFIMEFWQHNQMALRIDEWSDELARSGELFPVLFTNPVSGMSQVRTVAASMIRAVDFDAEDYERELRYLEVSGPAEPEKWWMGPGSAEAMHATSGAATSPSPVLPRCSASGGINQGAAAATKARRQQYQRH